MRLLTKTSINDAWHRIKAGARVGSSWRSRLDVFGAARLTSRALSDLVFPPGCVSCHAELLAQPDVPLCDDCLAGMEFFAEPTCVKCGAPVPNFTPREGAGSSTPPKRQP